MRRTFRTPLASLVIALVWLALLPGVVGAHGGPPRVELSAGRLAPGAALDVRGVNIAAEQDVTITLTGARYEIWLGTATGDAHGDFMQTFSLPADLPQGSYSLRAAIDSRVIAGASLVVAGAPVSADNEVGLRDDDEPLLAPLPGRQAITESGTAPAAPNQSTIGVPILLVAAIGGALALLILAARRSAVPRSS